MQLESVTPNTFFVADGVAADHPFSARIEAAHKIIGNHEKVPPSLHPQPPSPRFSLALKPPPLHPQPPSPRLPLACTRAHYVTYVSPLQVHLDMYRPGLPPTQPELERVTGQERVANAFLVETASRLLGRR